MITVLGGHGFIGSAFCRGVEHYVISNDKYDYDCTGVDVVNFMSTVSNYNVLKDPYVDIGTNLRLLITTLESWRLNNIHNPVGCYTLISSWFVYGDTELPARETSPCNPKGFYSITKRTAEQLLISYCETFGIKYRILRLANVIGGVDTKASKEKNALQFLLDKIKNGEDVNVYDGGNIIRDYIQIDDAIDAIDLVLGHGSTNAIYNIGNGEPIRFGDILDAAKEVAGSKSNLIPIPIPEFHKKVQVRDMYMDTTKLKLLGYRPVYDFKKNLSSVVRDLLYVKPH